MARNNTKKVPTIVVGVDGSAGAHHALRWAVEEARLRRAPLRAVHAWTAGYAAGWGEGYAFWAGSLGAYAPSGIDEKHLCRAAEQLLDRALADAGADAAGIDLEREAIQGGAAKVLVGAVTADDLLVVGSRGHGGFTGVLLGSVSQQCVHHAPCPVVVVHTPKAKGRDHETVDAGHEVAPV